MMGCNWFTPTWLSFRRALEDRPPQAYGYEYLDVMKTPEGKRPQVLDGKFGQCAMGQTPVFSGEVYLVREGSAFAKAGNHENARSAF